MKRCKQCGEVKPEAQFRPYYKREGTYNTCLTCEKVNSRHKYLKGKQTKGTITPVEQDELDEIYKLYHMQRTLGYAPPIRVIPGHPVVSEVSRLIARYEEIQESVANMLPEDKLPDGLVIPEELAGWLTEPLDREPEYYQQVVYEMLLDKYSPILRLDRDTLLPVRDTIYKPILDRIVARFDEWEDTYYTKDRKDRGEEDATT